MTFADSTNTLQIYVDGALAAATKALEADGAGHVVTLGNLLGSNPFSGVLDEVRIYRPRADARRDSGRSGDAIDGARHDAAERCRRPDRHGGQRHPDQPELDRGHRQVAVTGYRVERCQGAGCRASRRSPPPDRHDVRRYGPGAATSYSYRVEGRRCGHQLSVTYSTVANATTQAQPTPLHQRRPPASRPRW